MAFFEDMELNFPSLDTIKEWSTILAAHQWPILIIAIVLIFRDEIRKAVDLITRRIKSYKGFGGEFELGDFLPERPMDPSTPTAPKNWRNINSIYWLSYNLVSAMAITQLKAPGHKIVTMLRRSLDHFRQLPLSGTAVEKKLERILSDAEDKIEKDWTDEARNSLANDMEVLLNEISRILEEQQRSSQGNSTTK